MHMHTRGELRRVITHGGAIPSAARTEKASDAGAEFAEVEVDSVRQWDSAEVTRMVTTYLEECQAAGEPEPAGPAGPVADFSPRGGNSPRSGRPTDIPRREVAFRRITQSPMSTPRGVHSRR
jgi:hypothetical protein